jgi:hypothetical protein
MERSWHGATRNTTTTKDMLPTGDQSIQAKRHHSNTGAVGRDAISTGSGLTQIQRIWMAIECND